MKKKNMSKKKGGSKSSLLINNLTRKNCNSNFVYPSSIKSIINKDFVSSMYGSNYKTTGGGNNKNWFSKTFIPNTINRYMNNKKSKKTVLGMMKEWNIKNKKNKISKLYCNKILRELKKKNKVMAGGKIIMPKQWFSSNFSTKKKTIKKQRGGTKTINHGPGDSILSGANVPFGNSYRLPSLQGINNFFKGEASIIKDSRSNPTNDENLHLNCVNNNCNELINSPGIPKDPVVNTNGFNINNNTLDNVKSSPSNLWKNSEYYSTKDFSPYEIPQPRAGKRSNKNRKKSRKNKYLKKSKQFGGEIWKKQNNYI
jgi:hypothetical protein